MIQIKIDTSDAVLMGSQESYTKMSTVFNRYHLRANILKLEKDAYYKGCMRNENCTEMVNGAYSDIVNAHLASVYESMSEDSMTNEEWEEAHLRAAEIYDMASGDTSSDEFYELINEFYSTLE